ncbi:MAG: type II toxin-antitoxin system HicA family toxin [Methylovulum sp.]|uniref:type II toxin-antitoxin system HicA family toxin n=1 Tax=Methylovulum sp. TaxID=1916980 RepID=UPI00262F4C63|nr:type II toxin-antitoxin system HicA family toxin [Methylovulum sp.]MDD2725300.1 type II toxin-antitoxin system HicA family toxin [Methylovulum sp.]MDD5125123.1 type II toxin-antitoxin system HicA family toxin [Methylovulum sp.]
MPKLSPISWRELVANLKALGFSGPYEGGKHPYMIKGRLVLTLPNPHKQEISVDLLKRLLKQADIDRDAWLGIKK